MRIRHTEQIKGSITVETALILPFFVIVMVLMVNILVNMQGYFRLRKTVYECAEAIAEYSYVYEVLMLSELQSSLGDAEGMAATVLEDLPEAKLGDLLDILKSAGYKAAVNQLGMMIFKGMIDSRFSSEELEAMGVSNGKKGLYYGGSRFFYSAAGHGALIKLKLTYRPRMIMGTKLFEPEPVQIVVYTHAFLGENPFETEEEEEEPKVYRIGEGAKFHVLDCYLIDKNITEMSRTEAIAVGLEGCSLCKAWEATQVCVSKGGEKYHKKGCSILYPELIEMTFDEAKAIGLDGCKLCIDEDTFFVGNK